jgi:hypothetical protein
MAFTSKKRTTGTADRIRDSTLSIYAHETYRVPEQDEGTHEVPVRWSAPDASALKTHPPHVTFIKKSRFSYFTETRG